MKQFLWAAMVLGSAVAVAPQAEAQIFRRPFHGCCETCTLPHASCTCSQTRPVVQTQLQARQVTTYRDVVETHVRNESVVQNVPVTTYKQVTVDEGGYQMVWVPKPVTKQVAQTVIQQQVQTRAVPYQVVRKVPQISTQLVPVQTVHHITETVPMTTWAPAPVMFQAAGSCNTCNHSHAAAFAPVYPIQTGTAFAAPAPYLPAAAPPAIATMPAISVPLPQSPQSPSAAPAPAPEQWQTIPSRPSSAGRNYESPAAVPAPMDEARSVRPRAGQFVAAPSAATVWAGRQAGTLR